MKIKLTDFISNAKKQLMAPPLTWEPQPQWNANGDRLSSGQRVYDVPRGTEWDEVKQMLVANGQFQCTVKKIQRFQNPDLWKRYVRERGDVAKDNGGNANEHRDLKHGTGTTDPATIIAGDAGIDPRYSDWGLFGNGAYFAEQADYSHNNGYVYKVGDGSFQMFICRVAAGKVDEREGKRDTSGHPTRHPAHGHQSVRGIVRGSQYAYIVYEMYRTYPEYLVTYTV